MFCAAAQSVCALSTANEITQARTTDREIVTAQGVLQNPLLNAWVDRIAASDWRFVGRKDVPYSIKILDEGDVNAFTIGGGFIYINAGALDFVGSDDELAGVIGHETGHNEHRHPITLRQRGEVMNILFGLAAIFVPVTLGAGAFAEEGLMAHASRTDEYQADQYGLMVMTHADYDPDAMLSFMQHLGDATDGEEVDKYLADHPGVPQRIKRLSGYKELNPAHRTTEKLLHDAMHDAQTARYSIAMQQFQRVLKRDPRSAAAELGLGRMQVALGYENRARQSFAGAQALGDAATKQAAASELRAMPLAPPFRPLPSAERIGEWRAAILARRASLQHDSEGLSAEITANRARLDSLQARLTVLTNETADLANLHDDEKSETSLPHELQHLGRSVNATIERASTILSGVGTLTIGRESGLLNEARALMQETAALVSSDTPSPASVSRLRAIPSMLAAIAQTEAELQISVAQTTTSLAELNGGLDRFEQFLHLANTVHLQSGDDIDLKSHPRLRDAYTLTLLLLDQAFESGDTAASAYNRARALELENRITLLGVDATPASFEAFRRAVALRCGIPVPSTDVIAADHLTPGELAAATILAAEKQRSVDAVVKGTLEQGQPIVSAQSTVGTDALALEIFLGLIYLDYTDVLTKEA